MRLWRPLGGLKSDSCGLTRPLHHALVSSEVWVGVGGGGQPQNLCSFPPLEGLADPCSHLSDLVFLEQMVVPRDGFIHGYQAKSSRQDRCIRSDLSGLRVQVVDAAGEVALTGRKGLSNGTLVRGAIGGV